MMVGWKRASLNDHGERMEGAITFSQVRIGSQMSVVERTLPDALNLFGRRRLNKGRH
jgi:hypothetical protein